MLFLIYLPVSASYILSMAVGYFGLRYLQLSVSSPIQNSSGAVVAVLCVCFFGAFPGLIDGIGIVLLAAGVFALSLFESREEKAELGKSEGDEKYRFGKIAFIFPIIYCVIDALGTFLDTVYLDKREILTEEQALIAYEYTFFAVGVICLLWVFAFRREKPELRGALPRYGAAVFETAGQFFYVYAIAGNGMVSAPIVSSYCVVSLLLSRIILKEKLTAKKYAAIAVIVLGIVLLGIAEGME